MTLSMKMLRIFSAVFYALLALGSLAVLIGTGIFFYTVSDLPRVPEPLNRIIQTPPTEIYAATGERIMVLGQHASVPLNRVSPHFLKAVIATEDHRFQDHNGVDKLRTLKALWITLFKPGRIEGASTITQQLAKNLFFSFKRSYKRKFRELLVALQIENRFSKQEILEAYINQIAFGPKAYGIEQAAISFFNKSASQLTLAESALLAGLPKSPTRYNPYRHFERAKKRQRVVLLRMVTTGYISREWADRAFAQPLILVPSTTRDHSSSYYIDMVINRLEERYGPDIIYHGGLRVYTTLDPQLQSWATEAMTEGLVNLDRLMGINDPVSGVALKPDELPQGALVAVETSSGAIRALVGGRNYSRTAYNRAVHSHRQPGSGFKPFVYYTALEKLGLTPASVMVDKPVNIPVKGAPNWRPRNFGRRHQGPMILKKALMKSVNTIAAQLVARTGPEAVIETAHRCGIKSPLAPVYSVALGTSGVSPLEMASAYATFAAGGIHHDAFCIQRIENANGTVLEEHIAGGGKVLDAGIAYQIEDMMSGVIDSGSGAVIRRMGFTLPAAGKTGTTNRYKDAWFTGFTPTLSTSIWVGFDQEKGLRDKNGVGITGGRGAAPIWADFMLRAMEDEPPRVFAIPPEITFEDVDPITGRPTTAGKDVDHIRVSLLRDQRIDFDNNSPDDNDILLPESPGTRIIEEDLDHNN
ncbi:MAG: PBP1A family penicillin-binding protein [Deltaproteobacteria bacterium]|nr:PBP1A family penicillin-binding protein [Deltaproteobacteria bacterium]